jgi:hypothetical protein
MSEPVTYADGKTPVLPGDRVSVRLFFRRRVGEVIYVPGISKRQGAYEHNGLTWVGISLPDGWAVGQIVLPETNGLKRTVRFLGRGGESPAGAEALERIAQQDAQEEAELRAAELEAATPVKARPLDWVAAVVAVVLQLGLFFLFIGLMAGVVLLMRKLF